MGNESTSASRSEVPTGLEFAASLFGAAIHCVPIRDFVTFAASMVLIYAAAEEAAKGPLSLTSDEPEWAEEDPILVEVGATPIRVSDARAQAVLTPETVDADILPPEALFAVGLVDEAADQVALAKAAEEHGIDEALEIKAELALARRRILSSAYLDLAVKTHVTDGAVREAYRREVATAANDQLVDIRRILLPSRTEALAMQARLQKGASFSKIARRYSRDEETKSVGGYVGEVRVGELPEQFAQAVKTIPVGGVSDPIEGEQGWYLVTVEARSAVFMPTFDAMRPVLVEQLRDQVVTDTVLKARSAVPIRLAAGNGTRSVAQGGGSGAGAASW